MKLILASTSPRRIELLKRLNIPFEVHPPQFDESSSEKLSPEAEAILFARAKALSLKARFPEATIIGSDTLVVLSQKKLGKPETPEAAKAMLRQLSGQTHRVLTAVAVWHGPSGRLSEFLQEAKVTFKTTSEKEIEDYVATGEPLDKAGAYAIQGIGAQFIAAVEGDVGTVVGLPVKQLNKLLLSLPLK